MIEQLRAVANSLSCFDDSAELFLFLDEIMV